MAYEKTQNITRQRSLLKVFKVDGFSSLIYIGAGVGFFMLKVCFLEISQIPLFL